MREMKDSGIEWIGKIPEDWTTIPVKYCITIENGSEPQTEGDTPVYGSGTQSFKTCGEYKDGPTVLLGRKGTVNIPQYVTGRYWNVDTAFDAKSRGAYDLKLFYYDSICFDYDNYSTQTALPSMTQNTYNNFQIPFMNIQEQHLISTYLDAKCSEIDALTADIQSQIDTLEQYKRSFITESVTKGLDKNVEMKESGIEWAERIPAHWQTMHNKYLMHKVKEICPIYNGEDILSLTMQGVVVRDFKLGGKMPTTFDGYQIIHPGNLLMCLFDYDVTPRCIGYIENEGLTSPAYSQFVMESTADAHYYYYYYLMLDFTKELLHLAKNLRHSFTEDQLGKINTIVPPLNEQKEIADYLDKKVAEVDKIISLKNDQVSTLDAYKKSIIYEYVTGKKEVHV